MKFWSLGTSQRVIVLAGCLASIYTQLSLSPVTVEFARLHGASGFHVGIIGALPTATLFMQFVAAALVSRLRYRRRLFMTLSIVQRLALVPIALLPLVLGELSSAAWVWGLLSLMAINQMLSNFCSPLWLSWMGDYLPHDGLNRYWGTRQIWMQWTAAATLLVAAIVLFNTGLTADTAFAVLTVAGAICGVIDIVLFTWVEEPPVTSSLSSAGVAGAGLASWRELFATPLRDRSFRSFIGYSCFWNFASMIGAPFISLYLSVYVGMDLYNMLLLWSVSWVGGAVFSGWLGNLAEEYGHRPVLILCTAFKASNMIALLWLPADADLSFWVLIPIFMLDAMLNSGIAIAGNGFMIKNSPQANRTMFIAAGTAMAGMVGGITAIVAGLWLASMGDWKIAWGEGVFNGFHLLFLVSLICRLISVPFAAMVDEPHSRSTRQMVVCIIGATPLRFALLRFGYFHEEIYGEELFREEQAKTFMLLETNAKSDASEMLAVSPLTHESGETPSSMPRKAA